MHIESLQLHRIRNIDSAKLEPSPGVNLIVGANAAGKTSLLEAIDFLSRGRSFRAYRADELIQSGAPGCRVVGRVRGDETFDVAQLGIERSNHATRARLDGADASSLSALARRLAVVVLEPLSLSLVNGGPAERRAFVDWGAFHSEEAFLPGWKRFGRLLAQRNALLKGRAETRLLDALDAQVAFEGEAVGEARAAYLSRLAPLVSDLAGRILGEDGLSWQFRKGWREDESLQDALARKRTRDRERGFTSVGPHRADLELTLNQDSLSKTGSRGQQKASVAVLKLAQAGLYREETGERAVLLLDDVASELDRTHRAGVLEGVSALGGQVFVTAIEEGALRLAGDAESKLFHVEHGRLQELV